MERARMDSVSTCQRWMVRTKSLHRHPLSFLLDSRLAAMGSRASFDMRADAVSAERLAARLTDTRR